MLLCFFSTSVIHPFAQWKFFSPLFSNMATMSTLYWKFSSNHKIPKRMNHSSHPRFLILDLLIVNKKKPFFLLFIDFRRLLIRKRMEKVFWDVRRWIRTVKHATKRFDEKRCRFNDSSLWILSGTIRKNNGSESSHGSIPMPGNISVFSWGHCVFWIEFEKSYISFNFMIQFVIRRIPFLIRRLRLVGLSIVWKHVGLRRTQKKHRNVKYLSQ